MCCKEMETCPKHLKKYNGAISGLVEGNEKLHNWVDKRAKEVEGLKGRVLELETQNILLEAKVGRILGWELTSAKCQGAVFMAAKFKVFPTLSLKTFTHFTFLLELIRQTPLSLPSFPFTLKLKHRL